MFLKIKPIPLFFVRALKKALMKKFIVPLVVIFLLFSFSGDNWKEVNSEDGIIVYNAEVSGSKFKKSMAETTIRFGSIEKAEKILKDASNYKNWQPNCESGKILSTKDDKLVFYLTFGAPWPVSDRDIILESIYIKSGNKLIVKNTCKPNYLNKQKDYVRISYSESSWDIEKKEDGALSIRTTSHSNPGGNIPSWLTASTVEEIPLETLKGFVKLLK